MKEVLTLERLCDTVGSSAALRLTAFFGSAGSPTLYVPETATPGHRIEKIIGGDAFGYLVQAHGGETICLPNLSLVTQYQRAGAVASMVRHGMPFPQIARTIGLTRNRVRDLAKQLDEDGLIQQAPGRQVKRGEDFGTVLLAAGELQTRLAEAVSNAPTQTAATRRAARLVERAGQLLREAGEFTGGSQMLLTAAACGALESAEAEMTEETHA